MSKTVWDFEYSRGQIIPSSTRQTPSHILLLFSELLGFRNMKRALDAGCGNGRNAIYLANLGLIVDAVDFSQVALGEARIRARNANVENRISFHERGLEEPFPFTSGLFDLCLDLYVSCHFTNEGLKDHYVRELWRVTRPGGFAISAVFSPSDEYYRQFIKAKGHVVTDPGNRITKELYTKGSFETVFAPPFKVAYLCEFQFDDIVQGRHYRRSILSMALQRETLALDRQS